MLPWVCKCPTYHQALYTRSAQTLGNFVESSNAALLAFSCNLHCAMV
jgi:hypothetical protein